MAEERSSPASSVCYLDETPDAYAGYLTVEEGRALIRRWHARTSRADIATRFAALLPAGSPVATQPDDDGTISPLSDKAMQTEIRQALPKFRDDALHRALSEIADRL